MRNRTGWIRIAVAIAVTAALPWSGHELRGQTQSSRTTTVTDVLGRRHTIVKPITQAERQAAALRLKNKRALAAAQAKAAYTAALASGSPLAASAIALAAALTPSPSLLVGANGQLIPDYSGVTPNWALSPSPTLLMAIDPTSGAPVPVIDSVTGLPVVDATLPSGIRKFVDGLPGLGQGNANNLGQYLPVGIPDTTAFPGSDYYEIELGQYTEKMHSDLPATTLRGYRQTNMGGTPFHYLGPVIVAQRGRPVRMKFTNHLPTGAGGNLFLPVDATIMGAGPGPQSPAGSPEIACKHSSDQAVPSGCYTENRATLHLHGGVTPWISDGTPYQWITPANESTPYPEGVSVYNVPDMPNPGPAGSASNPSGSGSQTFYYTNDQSARLMFYHDHASGITRLNVYAGEAAGYLIEDPVEQDLVARGIIPADQIPLVIQDRTFVDATTVRQTDPTWNWGTGTTFTSYTDPKGQTMSLRDPVTGDLWLPHVYMPAQNPFDITGINPMGRWPYGPWFWPPAAVPFGPVANPYYDCNALGVADSSHACTMPWQAPEVPSTPNPSWGAEAFMDTPVVNGTVYPTLTVKPQAYRLRILDAANDRFFNLQLYVAADNTSATTAEATRAPNAVTRICDGSSGVSVVTCTEVKMLPAAPNSGLPANWPTDGRVGGLPDPALAGPGFLQIGSEGGFLPMPVAIPNQPIAWNLDPTTFNFGNVTDHALLLGPAERADVIVDFSAYAGKTLILYNDAPAPLPALMASNDYYTGAPDMRDAGGAFTTVPGYGPNTRTIMQIRVENTAPGASFNAAALVAEWAPKFTPNPDPTVPPTKEPGVFERGQDSIIVGQTAYNDAYGTTFPSRYPAWGIARIQDSSMTFQTPQGAFLTMSFQPKAIHDEMGATFDDYGRSSAKLGLELPNPGPATANFVMQGYADPSTELVMLSKLGVPIGGPAGDGTQIWKITHNGVDTHPIHFHLFHVQIINRVGWDGAIRLPDANELGWKDTLRISPLEDTLVALRPIAPDLTKLPWRIPNSVRLLNPALPIGSSVGFSGLDPQGNNVTVFNDYANFGWEYVWHCHILSHEENDMMRTVAFAVPPNPPRTLSSAAGGSKSKPTVVLTWTDPDPGVGDKTGYVVERAADPAFQTGLVTTPLGLVTTYSEPVLVKTPLFYRVAAVNKIGSDVQGFPTMTATSDFSNVVAINPVLAPGPLLATLLPGPRIMLTFNDNATNETGFSVERAVDGGTFSGIATVPARAGTGSLSYLDQAPVAGALNAYRIVAQSGGVSSAPSNVASVSIPAPPAAPTNLTATSAIVSNKSASITLRWTDVAINESNYEVQRSTSPAFTAPVLAVLPANSTTYTDSGAVRGTTFYVRVRATNAGGASAWSNVFIITTP